MVSQAGENSIEGMALPATFCRARSLSNAYPYVVSKRSQSFTRTHITGRKFVWACPTNHFTKTTQSDVRDRPLVTANGMPKALCHVAIAPYDVI